MSTTESLTSLRKAHPWPSLMPPFEPVTWGLEAGGKHLVRDQIIRNDVKVILEIGVFLGASARQWLAISPDVHVICVDPWKGGEWIGDFARYHDQAEWVCNQLTRDDEAFYQTFLRNMWEERHRVTPVRGLALDVLQHIRDCGVQPDLVYLDGDKTGRELPVCHELFPDAILTGDDWFCGIDHFFNPDKGYPIRVPVKEFCRDIDRNLLVDKMTWVITSENPSLKYRLFDNPRYQMKSVRRRVRGAFRGLLGLDKGRKVA